MKDEGRAEGEGEAVVREDVQDLGARTKKFSLRTIRMIEALPSTMTARVLGNQVLRSATSVGANYREARRARSDAEFISKIGDCLKELDETQYWLELLAEAEILPASRLSSLQSESDELLAILTSISKSLKTRSLYR
jgi:four helix bundle protein